MQPRIFYQTVIYNNASQPSSLQPRPRQLHFPRSPCLSLASDCDFLGLQLLVSNLSLQVCLWPAIAILLVSSFVPLTSVSSSVSCRFSAFDPPIAGFVSLIAAALAFLSLTTAALWSPFLVYLHDCQ